MILFKTLVHFSVQPHECTVLPPCVHLSPTAAILLTPCFHPEPLPCQICWCVHPPSEPKEIRHIWGNILFLHSKVGLQIGGVREAAPTGGKICPNGLDLPLAPAQPSPGQMSG